MVAGPFDCGRSCFVNSSGEESLCFTHVMPRSRLAACFVKDSACQLPVSSPLPPKMPPCPPTHLPPPMPLPLSASPSNPVVPGPNGSNSVNNLGLAHAVVAQVTENPLIATLIIFSGTWLLCVTVFFCACKGNRSLAHRISRKFFGQPPVSTQSQPRFVNTSELAIEMTRPPVPRSSSRHDRTPLTSVSLEAEHTNIGLDLAGETGSTRTAAPSPPAVNISVAPVPGRMQPRATGTAAASTADTRSTAATATHAATTAHDQILVGQPVNLPTLGEENIRAVPLGGIWIPPGAWIPPAQGGYQVADTWMITRSRNVGPQESRVTRASI